MSGDFSNQIIFIDQTHFHPHGFVNCQLCHTLSLENPREIVEKQMNPHVTVWCEFCSGGINRPFFLENAFGQAISVNGACYLDMIIQFLVPNLQDIEMDVICFQLDGATCRRARETIQFLHESFPVCIIPCFGD